MMLFLFQTDFFLPNTKEKFLTIIFEDSKEKIAIVEPGRWKSNFAFNLILRFYDVTSRLLSPLINID